MSPLPKLAPGLLRRVRIASWLGGQATIPLRFVCAPPGSGKTTAVVRYCAETQRAFHYYAVRPGDGVEALRVQLAAASGRTDAVESYEDLLARLSDGPPVEIVLDDLDGATAPAIADVLALVRDVPAHVTFLVTAADREAACDERLFGAGLAVSLDAARLAFTPDEVAEFAGAAGVAHDGIDVAELHEQSEGWAIVVSGAVREAAAGGTALRNAYAAWRAANGAALVRFAEAEAARRGDALAAGVRRLCAGERLDPQLVRSLESRGLFVHGAGRDFAPYRALAGLGCKDPDPAPADPVEPMRVQLFGRFEAYIGSRPIRWVRRRDQQVVQYVLLTPAGRATREELYAAFWPEVERTAAARNLRTACSTIRKAIGDAAGARNVERYFRSDGDLAVVLEHANVDARRFGAHLADGDEELDRGNLTNAIAHFGAAEKLSSPGLLSGDGIDPALEERVRAYALLREQVLERLARAWYEAANRDMARSYAKRLLAARPDHREMQRLVATLERRAEPFSVCADEEHVTPIAVERAPAALAS